jgi:hypothetical protein
MLRREALPAPIPGLRRAPRWARRPVSAACYTAFHIKLPFLELDYTASAKCRYQSHHVIELRKDKAGQTAGFYTDSFFVPILSLIIH